MAALILMPNEYRFGMDTDEAQNSPSLPVKTCWALTYRFADWAGQFLYGSSNYTDSNYALQITAWSSII